MALLAEELVEEWLNRQGYFSIRGVKIGVDEIDLLAIKFPAKSEPICRHIEVQASIRPMSYLTGIPKKHRAPGQSSRSAKARSVELLEACVADWVRKKYFKKKRLKS